MKCWLPVLLLWSASAWGDEAADRAAIVRTLSTLNELSPKMDPYSEDAEGRGVLDELWRDKKITFRLATEAQATVRPAVAISHEPWGEASIGFPGTQAPPMLAVNPQVDRFNPRLLTEEVAIVDATFVYRAADGVIDQTPLWFIVKKESGVWKVSLVRRGR